MALKEPSNIGFVTNDIRHILEFKTSGSFHVGNPFTPKSAKSKTGKSSKITNWVKLKNTQLHSKVLLNSFPMNGQTLVVIESKVRKNCII